jgi:hypothetical protein
MPTTKNGSATMAGFINRKTNSHSKGSAMSLISVRVTDIILNSSHPLYKEYGSEASIGTIFFESVNYPIVVNGNPSTRTALPLLPNISHYPVINELVPVVLLSSAKSSDTNDRLSGEFYYLPPINAWNTPHHNMVPSSGNNSWDVPQADYLATELGFVINTDVTGGETIVGQYFNEKDDVRPLQPYEGDIIYEGRWGNAIRFSSTVNTQPLPPWSQTNTPELLGSPITLITNGQQYADPLITSSFSFITENINLDKSSIYLTSTQNIPLNASVLTSSFLYGDNQPQNLTTYNSPQIILSSGRLVLNSKTDSIILTSPKIIHLSALDSINIDSSNKTTLASPVVNLGSAQADQQLILGNKFMADFKILLELLSTTSNTLSTLVSTPPGTPLSPALTINAINLADKCNKLSVSLNTYLSTVTKTS